MATNQELRAEIREFLVSRRARITPEQAGLRAFGTSRRVKGLRREEVATLAGVSAEYYTRVERGNVTGVSESVLDGIAHALQLDEAERAHLSNLVRAAGSIRPAPRRPATARRVRPTVQRILDSMVLTPALIVDSRLDILAANKLGEALYAPIFADPVRPPNQARFLFLDPHASDFWLDWATNADDAVALLRASAGRDPYDRRLTDLVGELATRSEDFRDPVGLPRRPQLRHRFQADPPSRWSGISSCRSRPQRWAPTRASTCCSTPPSPTPGRMRP